MAKRVTALSTYRPRIKRGPIVEPPELAGAVARRTRLSPADVLLTNEFGLLIEAKRVEGIDSFNVALPVGGNQVVGLIDGHGGATTGLSLVRRASGDRNGTAVMGRRFDDQDYHIVEYYVTPSSITLYFDGVYVFTWEGDSRDLSVDTRFWTPVFQRDVLVGSWSSSFDFRRIELYPAR